MSTAQHTPTPYEAHGNGIFKGMRCVATTCMGEHQQKVADAAFLNLACNCHDELVEALKESMTDLDADVFSQESDMLEAIDMLRLRLKTINNTVKSALAHAEAK